MMMKLTALPSSAGVFAMVAPAARAFSCCSGLRSQATTSWPCLIRCLSIAKPMRPTPMMPTFSLFSSAMLAFPSLLAPAIIAPGGFLRHIAFRDVTREQRRIAPLRIAVAAAARALQEELLAGAQLVAAGGRHVFFL